MVFAYFDCFSGISGDMTLGALLDLGISITHFKDMIVKIEITGYDFKVKRVTRNHISALDVYISVTNPQPHRSYKDIIKIISESDLTENVQLKSIEIFKRLAKAESRIHHIPYEDVHFHEVGAVDSIIDIIGTVILLDHYKIEEIHSSALPLGNSFVDCAHGKIPIPAPATIELLKNVSVYQTEFDHEMVTPTGAAIITTISNRFGGMPLMKIKKVGYGAGKIKSEAPGLLRVILGELSKE
jgi:uncharacterized protein (TIGR00299 family) protein